MDRKELIEKYLDFFKEKGHAVISNASLLPENDPTVLFTTAGMHPLVPFLLGQKHPSGKRLVNVQKCIRTGDIEEVGDRSHHTFFEMLGNWSLGDYFKEEAIKMTFEFFTKVLGLLAERLAVTVFAGDENAPRDEESAKVWKFLGMSEKRIAYLGKEDNWWGPAGKTGPCGPDTEVFYWTDKDNPAPENFDVKDKSWCEIGNNVLMQYLMDGEGKCSEANQKNVDFGGGVERILAAITGEKDNYKLGLFWPIIEKIEYLSGKKYDENQDVKVAMRIVADHIKSAVMILNDGVEPGNSEQGYVLRRLIRRAIRFGKKIGLENFTDKIADLVYEIYSDYKLDKNHISLELQKEEVRFLKTLENGLKIFEKLADKGGSIDGEKAFLLYQSYGFPIEMTVELAREKGVDVDRVGFEESLKKHQELSQTATAGKFKSGLADHSEQTTRLHTAAHLLDEAVRRVLGPDAMQRGSNITAERLRYDFAFDRKLTEEERKKIEDMVNEQIRRGLDVSYEEMSLADAKKSGAVGVFDDKYGEKVRVYRMGDFSYEICGGPHVKNTKELGKFKITKETSSSSGVRRIKAVVEGSL